MSEEDVAALALAFRQCVTTMSSLTVCLQKQTAVLQGVSSRLDTIENVLYQLWQANQRAKASEGTPRDRAADCTAGPPASDLCKG